MTELDIMKLEKDQTLAYWKKRAEDERQRQASTAKRSDISITVTTLDWFLWMIEEGCR